MQTSLRRVCLVSILPLLAVESVLFEQQNACAADTVAACVESLGGAGLNGWTGVKAEGGGALLSLPGQATFRLPDGPRGFYKHGFRVLNDSTENWQSLYGVQCEVKLPDAHEVELTFQLTCANPNGAATEVKQSVRVQGKGWHTITVPWSAFQFEHSRTSFLRFVKALQISGIATEANVPVQIRLRNVRVVKAPAVALECKVRGKSAPVGQTVEYPVLVSNCTNQPQSIELSMVRYGWEAMEASLVPAAVKLAPGQSATCTLRVKVGDNMPPGAHEEQVLQAIANGNAVAAQKLSFITACELPHPYILHTPARWQEVKDKVKNYPWAKAALDEYIKQAEAWQVPEIAKPPHNDPDDTMGPFLFQTKNELDLMACGIAWQLTGNKAYAEKAALFLRRLSDPVNGYAKTLRGCNQGLVQEGHFFQHNAMAYDMILDSGVLSQADRRQIEATFRMFIETIEQSNDGGSINNWNLSEVCGAFYCALAMQDLVTAQRFFSGPDGLCDQLSKGTMDDGWWYECTISYNVWCATEFTQAALAYSAWGVNFKDMWVPASYSPHVLLVPELNGGGSSESNDEEAQRKPFGMSSDAFGPLRRTHREIRDLWNGLLPFLDYRGVMFGVNDSTENKVAGTPFEVAYYVFRDPAYASVIKRGDGKRDLLYGVPELPAKTPEPFRESACRDNVGLAMLRSQTPDRPIRDQIQAALHYGTHGWAHGHYDRTDLISLMRYGRSFFNPEMIWYSYEPFMYKFYVQTSEAHNMVVVDEKMQEATPGKRLLFHTGKLMQAAAVETTARWSNPPYGGMVYAYVPVKTFEEKTWREGRYVPMPAHDAPAYGSLTGYTEPVLQRRLMVVTDDYVVLADYLKGEKPHTFESLLQMKGFKGLNAPKKTFLRHDAQWSIDPVKSAQFVTDCDWYSVEAPAVSEFDMQFGPGADNAGTRTLYNTDGVLKLGVHSLWPQQQQIMIGAAPEDHEVRKRLYYSVRGDGKVLAEGKFGAWILGEAPLDIPLDGVKQLELETKVELSKKPTVFWANARIVTKDGKEIPLSQLAPVYENTVQPKTPGRDYFGGPIKVVGTEYGEATPGQPKDTKQPSVVRIDLSKVNAARFKAVLGGDYPLGDEAQRRKTYAVRVQGREAQLITVIEPFEDKPMVKSAEALGPDKLRVELNDGRVQELEIHNLRGSGKDISVAMHESKAGVPVRDEEASAGK